MNSRILLLHPVLRVCSRLREPNSVRWIDVNIKKTKPLNATHLKSTSLHSRVQNATNIDFLRDNIARFLLKATTTTAKKPVSKIMRANKKPVALLNTARQSGRPTYGQIVHFIFYLSSTPIQNLELDDYKNVCLIYH